MMRGIVRVFFGLMFMLSFSPCMMGQEDPATRQFLDELQQQEIVPEAGEWNEEFRGSFMKLYRESRINPQTLSVISRSLLNSRIKSGPQAAAAALFEIAEQADREIRRGKAPKIVREELRQRVEKYELEEAGEFSDALRKQRRGQIKNNLKNRGRGSNPYFIPPGRDQVFDSIDQIRDQYPPQYNQEYDGEDGGPPQDESGGSPENVPSR